MAEVQVDTSSNKNVLVIGGAVLGVALLVFLTLHSTRSEDPSAKRWFMDSGVTPPQPFAASVEPGMKVPLLAPSGKAAGYPAEPCYWTKDGKSKTDPTYVLVNQYLGKSGPTFCPDCGRLVVPHNPEPDGKRIAPPTKEQYRAHAQELDER